MVVAAHRPFPIWYLRFKSVEEAEAKLARTSANSPGTGSDKFADWRVFDKNEVDDSSAYDLYSKCLPQPMNACPNL